MQSSIEAGYIEGLDISAEKVTLSVPFTESGSIRWKAYSDLLRGILRTAAAAKRIYLKASLDFESSFAGVRKTVEATEAEFESLTASSKKMSTQIAASTTEINDVMRWMRRSRLC